MLTSPWRQFRLLSRLFGMRHLLHVKRKHDTAQPHLRGYMTTSCMWALLECGFLDAMHERGSVDVRAFAREHDLDVEVLEPVVEYLDGLSILRKSNGEYALDEAGRRMMEEPRGFYDLVRGYKPVLEALPALLRGRAHYGQGVVRDISYVAKGSGTLGTQFPFPMMRDLLQTHGKFKVLDIGCGDPDLLLLCCEDPRFECWGFDNDPAVIEQARARLAEHPLGDRVHVCLADMFDLDHRAAEWACVDALVAIDVFHEHLWDGPQKVQALLESFRRLFPQAWLFVAEFCPPAHEWLRKHPTLFLDHELCHALTKQRVQEDTAWVAMFERAGYAVEEARVFPFVGLGYFALR